ncbi:MAG: sigma-70 family RNA polymerase sigma factor [Calditrichales bacterium]|nr:sigma-70 family RNA polymerase sigma factor [Calditrichales bacterium]
MVKNFTDDDFNLIRNYQQGEEQAFSKLFHKYYPLIYQILISKGIPQTEAEDMTSEIFITLIEALKSYRFESPFEHYLRRVVRNRIFDFYRKKDVAWCYKDLQHLAIDQTENFEQAEIDEIVDLCLQQIKNLVRRSIIACWLEGYKRNQIAELLELPLGTIHSNIERGKVDFKKCVQGKLV